MLMALLARDSRRNSATKVHAAQVIADEHGIDPTGGPPRAAITQAFQQQSVLACSHISFEPQHRRASVGASS